MESVLEVSFSLRQTLKLNHNPENQTLCLEQVIDDPNSSKLILVMEFVDGGVVDCGHPIKEWQARKYFRDAGKASGSSMIILIIALAAAGSMPLRCL